MNLKQLWSIMRGRQTNFRWMSASWTYYPNGDPVALPNPRTMPSLTAAQKAYGLLWQEISDRPRVHEARRTLLASMTKAFLSVGMWALCFVLSLVAGMSFSSVNIGDSLQAREAVTQRRQVLAIELSAVQAERVKIVEERDPVIIEERIQLARGRTGSFVLKSSSDCRDITLMTSAQACSEVNELRAAKRMAERRIELENKSRVLSEQIAALPPIGAKDPGSEGMSRLTAGFIESSMWENFRIIGYAVMPSLGGFLLAFARALFRA